MKIQLKTPITYYGGKQKLLQHLLPRIPEHDLYAEIFTGGAALFFAKEPSKIEVLNDTNRELINFYKVVQNDFVALEREIRISLHSRDLHRKASVIYNHPDLFTEVKRAWAIWVLSVQSFSAVLDGAWGYDRSDNTTTKKITNKRGAFTEEYAIRLQNVQIESSDALYIISSRDSVNSFFYCDPPYVGSDCGHYDGYSQQDFDNLLQSLSKIKGKFLLSSYPNKQLMDAKKANNWQMWSIEQGVSVNAKSGYLKRKTEVLTANFPI